MKSTENLDTVAKEYIAMITAQLKSCNVSEENINQLIDLQLKTREALRKAATAKEKFDVLASNGSEGTRILRQQFDVEEAERTVDKLIVNESVEAGYESSDSESSDSGAEYLYLHFLGLTRQAIKEINVEYQAFLRPQLQGLADALSGVEDVLARLELQNNPEETRNYSTSDNTRLSSANMHAGLFLQIAPGNADTAQMDEHNSIRCAIARPL